MSCTNCNEKKGQGQLDALFPCACDGFVFPGPLVIPSGLTSLPRQIAGFPEFRRAMLEEIRKEKVTLIDQSNNLVTLQPLADWRARDTNDLGILLLEMWSYVCDVLSFYDEVLANEAYIRTSQLRPDVRKLIALLGYLPRPAVGSTVVLSALADGRIPVLLPAGTGFRSGAFNGNPPQAFELDKDVSIHPFFNKWTVTPPHAGKIVSANPSSLLIAPTASIRENDLLLLTDSADAHQDQGVIVSAVAKYTGSNGQMYTRITFAASTSLRANTSLSGLRLWKPTQTAGLWTVNLTDDQDAVGFDTLTLNQLAGQLKPGDRFIATYQSTIRPYTVAKVAQVMRSSTGGTAVTVNNISFTAPGIQTPVTQITVPGGFKVVKSGPVLGFAPGTTSAHVSPFWPWSDSEAPEITVYFGLQAAATVVDEPAPNIAAHQAFQLSGITDEPADGSSPGDFLLQDKDGTGARTGGRLDWDSDTVTPDPLAAGAQDVSLRLPVQVYGNVITATRGESVPGEKLGSGNASMVNQSFQLKKKPLTYYSSPTADNDNGVVSSLTVYVNGMKWTEVSNFYNRKENEYIYIVRQNDDGDSLVIFGDGIRGMRLPSGVDNIIANYRFGAERAAPPAGAVNQVATPVKGLQSVRNLQAAYGGDDAQPASDLRRYGPASVLILGRTVSLLDMEALTGGFPGVLAVKAEWGWDKSRQGTVAQISYIGDDGLSDSISQRLRQVSDPTVSILVKQAKSVPVTLTLHIKIDPAYLADNVITQARQVLTDPVTGILAPGNIGIGQPLYRSRIFGEILNKVPGAVAVDAISLGKLPFKDFAVTPGTGRYFDLVNGALIINGKEN